MGTHCDKLMDSGRRKFLTGASLAAVSAAALTVAAPRVKAEPAAARVAYPSNRLGNVKDLKVNEPYPELMPLQSYISQNALARLAHHRIARFDHESSLMKATAR